MQVTWLVDHGAAEPGFEVEIGGGMVLAGGALVHE